MESIFEFLLGQYINIYITCYKYWQVAKARPGTSCHADAQIEARWAIKRRASLPKLDMGESCNKQKIKISDFWITSSQIREIRKCVLCLHFR